MRHIYIVITSWNVQTFDFQDQVRAEVEAHQAVRGDVPPLADVFVRGNMESAPSHYNPTGRLQAAVLHQLGQEEWELLHRLKFRYSRSFFISRSGVINKVNTIFSAVTIEIWHIASLCLSIGMKSPADQNVCVASCRKQDHADNLASELATSVEPDLLRGPCLFQGLNPHQFDVIQSPRQGHHTSRLLVPQLQVHVCLLKKKSGSDLNCFPTPDKLLQVAFGWCGSLDNWLNEKPGGVLIKCFLFKPKFFFPLYLV